jgi:cysteine desulfurase
MQAYLDHAATTPLRPEALAAMLPYLGEHFGNPSGAHAVARRARRALDDARDDLAQSLGCDPGDVVFTSGGTESDNLAVLGAAATRCHGGRGRSVVVCSDVEHPAVRNACASAGGTTIAVDRNGRVDLDALADVLHPNVALVSVMHVNNEVGTVQPVAQVAALVRERAPGALVHSDAVAAVGWRDVATECAGADLVSISAHKFGGPKGVGALIVRHGARLAPVLYGGSQERDRRPGTQDVAGIVAMAAALRATSDGWRDTVTRVARLRDRLLHGLTTSIAGLTPTVAVDKSAGPASGDGSQGVETAAYSCHVCIDGVDQEELLVLLDDAGVCASAGSACASGAIEPSHVLRAMGLDARRARSAVRLSLGYSTTDHEIDHVLSVMPKVVEQLRA